MSYDKIKPTNGNQQDIQMTNLLCLPQVVDNAGVREHARHVLHHPLGAADKNLTRPVVPQGLLKPSPSDEYVEVHTAVLPLRHIRRPPVEFILAPRGPAALEVPLFKVTKASFLESRLIGDCRTIIQKAVQWDFPNFPH